MRISNETSIPLDASSVLNNTSDGITRNANINAQLGIPTVAEKYGEAPTEISVPSTLLGQHPQALRDSLQGWLLGDSTAHGRSLVRLLEQNPTAGPQCAHHVIYGTFGLAQVGQD